MEAGVEAEAERRRGGACHEETGKAWPDTAPHWLAMMFDCDVCVRAYVCVCVCVRACVRACVRTCVHACERACGVIGVQFCATAPWIMGKKKGEQASVPDRAHFPIAYEVDCQLTSP